MSYFAGFQGIATILAYQKSVYPHQTPTHYNRHYAYPCELECPGCKGSLQTS